MNLNACGLSQYFHLGKWLSMRKCWYFKEGLQRNVHDIYASIFGKIIRCRKNFLRPTSQALNPQTDVHVMQKEPLFLKKHKKSKEKVFHLCQPLKSPDSSAASAQVINVHWQAANQSWRRQILTLTRSNFILKPVAISGDTVQILAYVLISVFAWAADIFQQHYPFEKAKDS